jgi:Na+/H+ antiporter NhaD/arsenite permease-like protein
MQDLTRDWVGLIGLLIFVLGYLVVIVEERLRLRKSIPVLVAAGAIWVLIGFAYLGNGDPTFAAEAFRHNLLDFAELFLFLIVAMTYVNTMEERGVFGALRAWLLARRLSFRGLFWTTGAIAFVISPIADNLTTALVMGAVVIAMGGQNKTFVALACINVVVAANAGGAFSPFGDITTLMVWQDGRVSFTGFFALFLPSLINWLVPATIMATRIEAVVPPPIRETAALEAGAGHIVVLFVATISLTVALHSFLHLPPAAGMMLGLGMLKLYSYLFNLVSHRRRLTTDELDNVFAHPSLLSDTGNEQAFPPGDPSHQAPARPLHIFRILERVEWDTLMFFYGVILGVGGLATLGYLVVTSQALYQGAGATAANVAVGILSAIVDNVPVMFAVLSMDPQMPLGQWLLVTLTAGVGGSLLSIGSAAGVALMGQARGAYTFMSHLRWTWAIALGYASSVAVHLLINRHLF